MPDNARITPRPIDHTGLQHAASSELHWQSVCTRTTDRALIARVRFRPVAKREGSVCVEDERAQRHGRGTAGCRTTGRSVKVHDSGTVSGLKQIFSSHA